MRNPIAVVVVVALNVACASPRGGVAGEATATPTDTIAVTPTPTATPTAPVGLARLYAYWAAVRLGLRRVE